MQNEDQTRRCVKHKDTSSGFSDKIASDCSADGSLLYFLFIFILFLLLSSTCCYSRYPAPTHCCAAAIIGPVFVSLSRCVVKNEQNSLLLCLQRLRIAIGGYMKGFPQEKVEKVRWQNGTKSTCAANCANEWTFHRIIMR